MDSIPNQGSFCTTHWSLVLEVAHGADNSPEGSAALNTLCRSYWYPLYAFVRRQGRNQQEAEDLIQEFFARLLAGNGLASVRPENGRFRSFLLAALKNFLANDWDHRHAVKRGGHHGVASWDQYSAEERYRLEPRHDDSPERLYERSWALVVLQSVLEQLRQEYLNDGKGALYDAIWVYLEDEGRESYAEIAARLGMTGGSIKMAVVRLREKFRHRLRAEVSRTVGPATDLDDELRHLFNSLGH